MIMSVRKSASARVYYGILVVFMVVVAPFLLSVDQTLTISEHNQKANPYMYSNHLNASNLYDYYIDNEYSYLQSPQDIDPSIEIQAQQQSITDDANRCSRIFLYLPDYYADHGHGSQINTYILAVLTATYLNRALILLEPPMALNDYPGGSQFGCPVDAFREAMYNPNNPHQQHPSMSSPIWTLRNDFPLGLSRLIQHPTWLSHGCDLPCSSTYQYKDWVRLYKKYHDEEGGDFPDVTCTNHQDGSMVNVVASGGSKIRLNFKDVGEAMIQSRRSPEAKQWIRNLGGSNRDVLNFANKVSYEEAWDYISGIMIRSGLLKFQPWIARDVELFFELFHLPLHKEFSAIHVRRGDKLLVESKPEVREYWKQQGQLHSDNYKPNTNYIPFIAYLDQWDGPDKCKRNRWGKLQIQKENVYVATDDPIVVKQEVANLPNHINKNTVLWNECYELTFYFSPADFHSFHLNGHHGGDEVEEDHDYEGGRGRGEGEDDGAKDNCFARYDRNIVSIADMVIAAKSRTFIGEYNSNWGRLVRTMRVRLNKASGNKWLAQMTRTLDTRVAWGNPLERPPGY